MTHDALYCLLVLLIECSSFSEYSDEGTENNSFFVLVLMAATCNILLA